MLVTTTSLGVLASNPNGALLGFSRALLFSKEYLFENERIVLSIDARWCHVADKKYDGTDEGLGLIFMLTGSLLVHDPMAVSSDCTHKSNSFKGALGGIPPPKVTKGGQGFLVILGSGKAPAEYTNLNGALARSCDVQKNRCADAANAAGSKNGLTVPECEGQASSCQSSSSKNSTDDSGQTSSENGVKAEPIVKTLLQEGASNNSSSNITQTSVKEDKEKIQPTNSSDIQKGVDQIQGLFAIASEISKTTNTPNVNTGSPNITSETPNSNGESKNSTSGTDKDAEIKNLQKFTGNVGGIPAPNVLADGTKFKVIVANGNGPSLGSLSSALSRSCDVQKNRCADAAHKANQAEFTVQQCEEQVGACHELRKGQKVNISTVEGKLKRRRENKK
ncbi:hypothetical protein CROQUDRAFT_133958 [Cronartium quercuum f. sp. fusiforme G11]|uniref:Uncharacterized protein n=1 Tax=Cronartium quercuum f. sp. fusiforme G11 TaxID=708437 RepID=A0A9P6TAC6_9BASI|nr:hypothetical protein CROQUDRAFT_133958 [Cronartium quercuum f. sp. fusiforme G11]